MIVYSETKDRFREDVFSNKIENVIHDLFKTRLKRSVGPSEVSSWKNSMQFMDRILEDDEIPGDARVGIEYTIPQSSKRIDFLLCGADAERRDAVVIVELKQWQQLEVTGKDAIVRTAMGGSKVETEHPSYQAWTYAALLEDYNETVRDDAIGLYPCAYLHNCVSSTAIRAHVYGEHLKRAPVFIRDDALALRDFIKQHVRYGDRTDLLYRIDNGRIKPSKNLADCLSSMLKGNHEFLMIDDQKLVYETALALAAEVQTGGKAVLIVQGGPGTGKSVVAINLLVELTKRDLVVQYVSRNAAPRAVYESKLVGDFKKSRISNLFKGSGGFSGSGPDVFDVLVVDEAHRLNEKSGFYQNVGDNQVKEIVSASKLSVFFLDEDQRVTLKDVGSSAEIRRWAGAAGAAVSELKLESQFRCNGSDGYLAFVDHALQIRDTANPSLEGFDYDFRVFDGPSELRDAIFDANRATNRARLVAGYCWPWASKKDPKAMDIVFPGTDFAMQWNLTTDGSLWIVKPESVKEVGCIHTCQGLELDYVGVIIGDDFVVRDGRAVVDVSRRARADKTVFGFKKLSKEHPEEARDKANLIIKNTYRTLMTRGMKGCFIFCTDAETNEYFKSFIGQSVVRPSGGGGSYPGLSVPILDPAEVVPFENAVPVFEGPATVGSVDGEIEVASGDWVRLSEPFVPVPGLFVTRMDGEAMNRRIPNGSWCLFRAPQGRPKNGAVVLARHREVNDVDCGGTSTIRLFEGDLGKSGGSVRLRPQSSIEGYRDITLSQASAADLQVLGELVAILS